MFLAWVVGASLHSQYLLREQWRRAVGIDSATLQEGVNSLAPHVLSFAALILFGYGVAWLLTVVRRAGLAWGVGASAFLWLAVFTATFLPTQFAGVSLDLLKLEMTYTFFAAVLIGAIIGVASGFNPRGRLHVEQ